MWQVLSHWETTMQAAINPIYQQNTEGESTGPPRIRLRVTGFGQGEFFLGRDDDWRQEDGPDGPSSTSKIDNSPEDVTARRERDFLAYFGVTYPCQAFRPTLGLPCPGTTPTSFWRCLFSRLQALNSVIWVKPWVESLKRFILARFTNEFTGSRPNHFHYRVMFKLLLWGNKHTNQYH